MADKIKVLMVDDEEQFRSTTSKILNRKGFATTLAGTGKEALEILKKSPRMWWCWMSECPGWMDIKP
jgi:CheY-like chemotaxis protein